MTLLRVKSFLLKNRSTNQAIAKNTFWLSFSNVIGRVVKAILIIIAARVLGTGGYGVFSYALSAAIIVTSLVDLGLNAIVAREISYKKDKDNRSYVSTALITKLALTILGASILITILPAISSMPEVGGMVPLLVLLVIFDSVREVAVAVAKGEERMEHAAFVQITTSLSVAMLGIVSLIYFPSSGALLLSYVMGSAVGLVYAFVWARRYFRRFWKFFDHSIVKKMLSEAIPFAFLGLLGIMMINTDVLMIGWIEGADAVGLYAAAQKPIEVLYVIPIILATAMLPVMARHAKNNNLSSSQKLLETMVKYSFMVALPATVGGIVLAEPIVNLLYGSSYLPSIIPFQILLITLPITYPGIIIANTVFAFNKQSSFTKFLLFGALANIIFNLLLIPVFSIVGSAIATIVAQLTANIFIWAKMKSIIKFRVSKKLISIVIAVSIMALSTLLMESLGVHYIANILISAAIYLGILKLLKEPLLEVKEVLRP